MIQALRVEDGSLPQWAHHAKHIYGAEDHGSKNAIVVVRNNTVYHQTLKKATLVV